MSLGARGEYQACWLFILSVEVSKIHGYHIEYGTEGLPVDRCSVGSRAEVRTTVTFADSEVILSCLDDNDRSTEHLLLDPVSSM